MVGHKAHGYPDKIIVPWVDRRDMGGKIVIDGPFASSQGFGGASLVTQMIKNPPAVQETQVQILGQQDPLEKGWATHSSILGFPLWLNW